MSVCPLCRAHPDAILENCRDLVCGISGSWTYQRCGGCGSLWMDPLPQKEDISGYYPEKYYTHDGAGFFGPNPPHAFGRLILSANLAVLEGRFGYVIPEEWWARAGGLGWTRRVQSLLPQFPAGRMARFLPFQKGGRLLDVGSGSGEFLALMRALGWEVEGIEPDARAIAQSAKAGLSVRKGGIEDAELEVNSYDAITLSHVIEHLLDPRAALERCVAALRPGGILVSLSPNPMGTNARLLQGIWRGLEPPRHLILPSLLGYRAILEGLPVTTKLLTSPMHMGYFRRWSRANAGISGPAWMETLWSRWLDYFGGPLRVKFGPEDGEEIVCIATKTGRDRETPAEAEGRV